MIIEEINHKMEERNKIRKIFSMLKDVKLPKHYKFVNDCVEIRYKRAGGFINELIAKIMLEDNDTLKVEFGEEEDYEKLRICFEDSKTKFKLILGDKYYY